MTVEQLRALAADVPDEYPMLGFVKWGELVAVQLLSEACRCAGYQNLARAVCGGKAWARKIATAADEESIRVLDEFANEPGWSWSTNRDEVDAD